MGTEFKEALTLLPDPEGDATLNTVALCLTCRPLVLARDRSTRAQWLTWKWLKGSLDLEGIGTAGIERKGWKEEVRETLGRKPAEGKSGRNGLSQRTTGGKTRQF